MILAALALAAQLPLQMSLDDYRVELGRIAASLRSGDIPAAQAGALELQTVTIAGPVPFAPDASLLKPIAALTPGQNPAPSLGRLEAAIEHLPAAVAAPPAPASDRASLRSIRKSWDLELKEGRVDLSLPRMKSPPEWLIDRISSALDTIGRWIRALWKALFGRELKPGEGGMGASELTLGLVALACGLFAVLAYRALRARRRAPLPSTEAEVIESDRDEDPTSRQPSEWEQHAEALARAGRYREAIRAWYHAVLSAAFSRGYVAYAKGRTNWEYVAALSPGLRFRSDVVSMTQRFEGCWYGGREADEQALFAQKHAAQAVLVVLSAGGAE